MEKYNDREIAIKNHDQNRLNLGKKYLINCKLKQIWRLKKKKKKDTPNTHIHTYVHKHIHK